MTSMIAPVWPARVGRLSEDLPVDLQEVDRQDPQLAQRGGSGAEVVHRGPHALRAQLAQVPDHVPERRPAGAVVAHGHQILLGDLHHQGRRRDLVGLQGDVHGCQERPDRAAARVRTLTASHSVRAVRPPAGELPAGPVHHPLADLAEQPEIVGDRQQLGRPTPCRACGAASAAAPRRRPGAGPAARRSADRRRSSSPRAMASGRSCSRVERRSSRISIASSYHSIGAGPAGPRSRAGPGPRGGSPRRCRPSAVSRPGRPHADRCATARRPPCTARSAR